MTYAAERKKWQKDIAIAIAKNNHALLVLRKRGEEEPDNISLNEILNSLITKHSSQVTEGYAAEAIIQALTEKRSDMMLSGSQLTEEQEHLQRTLLDIAEEIRDFNPSPEEIKAAAVQFKAAAAERSNPTNYLAGKIGRREVWALALVALGFAGVQLYGFLNPSPAPSHHDKKQDTGEQPLIIDMINNLLDWRKMPPEVTQDLPSNSRDFDVLNRMLSRLKNSAGSQEAENNQMQLFAPVLQRAVDEGAGRIVATIVSWYPRFAKEKADGFDLLDAIRSRYGKSGAQDEEWPKDKLLLTVKSPALLERIRETAAAMNR